nr:MAG TPA: hypothetical protein [Microviridae sp.]
MSWCHLAQYLSSKGTGLLILSNVQKRYYITCCSRSSRDC